MEKSKFEGNKPLTYYIMNKFETKCDLHYYNFEAPKDIELIEFRFSKELESISSPLAFGIKASQEEFSNYDFLFCPDGMDFVIHDRVLKIFQEICPNDFQRFDMVIKNLDPKDPPFENHDFHIINVTHRIKALDLEKSVYEIDKDHMFWLDKRVFKDEECWEGHLLAREHLESSILFHPKLAKKLRHSKGIQFLRDFEAPC